MRSFVVLLIAALLVTTVASGLMAFLLPFDIDVTRMHTTAAPLFTLFVIWHLFHNRRSLFAYGLRKHFWSWLAATGCLGVLATLLYYDSLPVRSWMNQSYESRRADVIFRSGKDVITWRVNGRIEVKRPNETVSVLLTADLAGDANDAPNHVVIWLEDEQGKLLETLYLSEKLAFRDTIDVDGASASRRDLLPVWWHRWKARKAEAQDAGELLDGVDAVTRPTAKAPFDFAAMVESRQPSFHLMIEVHRTGSASQIFSAMVELDRFKRYYLADLSGLGTPGGMLSYDITSLTRNDLLIDKVLITIDDNRSTAP